MCLGRENPEGGIETVSREVADLDDLCLGRENPEGGIETLDLARARAEVRAVWEERIPREGLKLAGQGV